MNNETNRLAQLIANAADKELGTRPDGQPRRQDKAAALAIEAEYLFIRRSELPEVRESVHDPNGYYVGNDNVVFTSEENARKWVMADIAVWQHIATKEQGLQRRRDELAGQFRGEGIPFEDVSPPLKLAIDRIIELERNAA
ncbi:hypothetical protein ACIPY0_20305 [Paenarthrobacter nicotinovorans]|uniref:hypothetical protein n=1 Tax=Paenarthrobacter nicotinovorans TaxID=29320 RepID=UPI0038153CE7